MHVALPRRWLARAAKLPVAALAGGVAIAVTGTAMAVTPGSPMSVLRPNPATVPAAPHQTPGPGTQQRSGATETASRANVRGVAAPVATVPVARLRTLVTPDVQVLTPHGVSPAQVSALRHAAGIDAVAVLDRGAVRDPRGVFQVVGVDPSEFRGFTPRLSAISDGLWQSVARGEVTFSYARYSLVKNDLGATLPFVHGSTVPVRIGAIASLGLPDVDAVVSRPRGAQLHLTRGAEILVAAPRLTLTELTATVHGVLGTAPAVTPLRPEQVDQSVISPYAASVIPAGYLRLYRQAATTCPGLPWTVLAGIGGVETGHGANTAVSSAGAMGPMQFMPSTWAVYGIDADGDGKANILDPVDAIFSAARYLCANGAGRGGQALYEAIFAYNHADWYVREVLALAVRYQ